MPDRALSSSRYPELTPPVRQVLEEALATSRNAVSLFDVGLARGLLAALQRVGFVNRAQLDRMYKACYKELPESILKQIDALPEKDRANLGKGIVVPAAPGTRDGRA